MHFKAKTKSVLEVLEKCKQSLSFSKGMPPIFENVKISCIVPEDGLGQPKVFFETTNSVMWVVSKIEKDNGGVLFEKPGSLCVSCEMLLNYVKALTNEDVTFKLDSEATEVRLKISSGRSRINLPIISPDALDTSSHGKNIVYSTVDAKPFLGMAHKLSQFCGQKMAGRESLETVYFDGQKAVATDGLRMAYYSGDIIPDLLGKDYKIHKTALDVIHRIFKDFEGDLELGCEDNGKPVANWIYLKAGTTLVGVSTVQREYPKYKFLLDKLNPLSSLTFKRSEMLGILKRLDVVMHKMASKRIDITARSTDSIFVFSKSVDFGEAAELLEENVSASENSIDVQLTLNGRFLKDALESLEGEDVNLTFSEKILPLAMKEGDYTYVIMPMRG